jgi:hypothetical protein
MEGCTGGHAADAAADDRNAQRVLGHGNLHPCMGAYRLIGAVERGVFR